MSQPAAAPVPVISDTADPPERRGWRRAALIAGPLGALLIYILSVGPVALIVKKTRAESSPLVRQCVAVVYAPAKFLVEKTPLRGPMQWYLKLWGVR